MKKILSFLLVTLFIMMMVSCKDETVKEIDDTNLKNAILNYDFSYNYFAPGKNLANEILWDGYSEGGNGYIQVDITDRLYTYQTSYAKINDGYYLVYVENYLLNQASSYLKEKESIYSNPYYPFSASDDTNLVDGKYLFSLQKQNANLDDAKVCYIDDINRIKKVLDDNTLIFICRTREATVLENISLKETLNHHIAMICKYSYDFATKDFKKNLSIIESNAINQFEQDNERIAMFRKSYESARYAYYPLSLGINSGFLSIYYLVYNINGNKYLKLPITTKVSGQTISLLDPTIDLYIGDDFYGDHKLAFAKAMTSDIPSETINDKTYAYFDLEKVKEIIS